MFKYGFGLKKDGDEKIYVKTKTFSEIIVYLKLLKYFLFVAVYFWKSTKRLEYNKLQSIIFNTLYLFVEWDPTKYVTNTISD